jgi:hypothetical protein
MSRSQAIALFKSQGWTIRSVKRFMSCGVTPVWDMLVRRGPHFHHYIVHRTTGIIEDLGGYVM